MSDTVDNRDKLPTRREAADGLDDGRLGQAVASAFDGIAAPDEVKHATLQAIAERRAADQGRGAEGAEMPAPGNAARKVAERTAALSGARSEAGSAAGAAVAAPAPRRRTRFVAVRRALTAAACVAVAALCVLGVRLYFTPAAYVGIDVNPSLELSVNTFGLVVDAQPLNDDAGAVLEGLALEGKPYDQALDQLANEGLSSYLSEDAYLEVSVTSSDEGLAQRLQGESDAWLQTTGCSGACSRVDEATREQAHHAGMGVGKYRAACDLAKLDPSVEPEDCAHMSMRELRDRIAACHEGGAEEGGHEGEGHHGHGWQGGRR